ncbi:hypothetical protein [Candidatus Hakubella thermalkaliphila]|uniref:hypothetical protein n=1 Tax=Candidatus Hakubella thermalkaliphila TaxID=2754717 RepID=UPI001593DB66|nr:hypothetical protein [Candidatus Hakubella thermalkaliphila]
MSSAVAMKVNLDVQLTLMASSLYRLMALKIGNGYENAKSRHIFRDFIDATANIKIHQKRYSGQIPKTGPQPAAPCCRFG